ncbi:MAG: HdeD family acid-resistance protein [Gammaproteobacteria bacterium]|nr:HdeD family acid-resistance protein [Gammaproteobacteria bacterium]
MQAQIADALEKNRGWFLALGIVWIVLGTVAIITPFMATLAIELLIGSLFLIGGIAQLIHVFTGEAWKGFFLHLFGALLALLAGGLLLWYPLGGVISLTLLLVAYFIAEGVSKIILAFQVRPKGNWGWLLFSGVIAIVLAGLIWAHFPSSAAWAIGLLVGINMLFGGWTLVMLAIAARSAPRSATETS